MKKLALAAAFSLTATSLVAGGMNDGMDDNMAEPMMDESSMDMGMDGDDDSMMPFVLLLLMGLGLAAS